LSPSSSAFCVLRSAFWISVFSLAILFFVSIPTRARARILYSHPWPRVLGIRNLSQTLAILRSARSLASSVFTTQHSCARARPRPPRLLCAPRPTPL
jgi:hypothetical protein